jgi:membrane-associated phospholipid phosphatase
MNRRLLAQTALIAFAMLLLGLLWADYPLAHWQHDSGYENAAFFTNTLNVLDHVVGIHIWYWLMPCCVAALGMLALLLHKKFTWAPSAARVLLSSSAVQAGTIGMMILGKNTFGRLRPQQLFESGDWTQAIWFVGGGSFPSGHSAFYFGLFLPLAAWTKNPWLRALLIVIPVFVVIARINLTKHFLSDVSASAVIAALLGLLAATVLRRWFDASRV